MVPEMLLARLAAAKEECFIGSMSRGKQGKKAITCALVHETLVHIGIMIAIIGQAESMMQLLCLSMR